MLDTLDRKSASTPHLAVLDALRGYAIVIVLWYHIWQIGWLSADLRIFGHTLNFNVIPETGMIGVYLFYFISGFCLFYPYARTAFDGRPAQSVGTFYYRRILKIVPSYYVGLAIWAGFGAAEFHSFGDAARQIVTHALFVETFFDDTFSAINGVLYTLAVEVQFYVIFPLVCWAMRRRPLLVTAACVAAGNLFRIVVAAHGGSGRQLDQLPGCIDLFGTGMFAAWAFRALATRAPELSRRRLLWTGVALLGLVLYFTNAWIIFAHRYDHDWLQGWKTYGVVGLGPVLVLLTVASLFAASSWQRALANPPLLFASYISYNLYLWHQWLSLRLEKFHPGGFTGWKATQSDALRLEFVLGAAALSIGVAWLITIAIEQPLLRARPFQKKLAAP